MKAYMITAATFAAMAAAMVSCSGERPMSEDYEKLDIFAPAKSMTVKASGREQNYTFFFNADGRISKAEYYGDDKKVNRTCRYQYDNGLLAGKQELSSTGNIDARHSYEYDHQGHMIAHTVFGLNNQDTDRWTFVYEGDENTEIAYYNEGDLQYRSRLSYDGDRREETALSPENDTLGVATVVFFKKDRIAEVDSDGVAFTIDYGDDGLPQHSANTLLDSQRNVVWEESLMQNPDRWYRYTFDAHGNWTVRKEYCHPDDSVSVAIIERSFKY